MPPWSVTVLAQVRKSAAGHFWLSISKLPAQLRKDCGITTFSELSLRSCPWPWTAARPRCSRRVGGPGDPAARRAPLNAALVDGGVPPRCFLPRRFVGVPGGPGASPGCSWPRYRPLQARWPPSGERWPLPSRHPGVALDLPGRRGGPSVVQSFGVRPGFAQFWRAGSPL